MKVENVNSKINIWILRAGFHQLTLKQLNMGIDPNVLLCKATGLTTAQLFHILSIYCSLQKNPKPELFTSFESEGPNGVNHLCLL